MRSCKAGPRQFALITVAILILIPLALLVVLVIAFGIEVVLFVLTRADFAPLPQCHRRRDLRLPAHAGGRQAPCPGAQASRLPLSALFCRCLWRWPAVCFSFGREASD